VKFRRSDFDVANTVQVTDPTAVGAAVEKIFLELFPSGKLHIIQRGLADITRLYRGECPGFNQCDTGYHDLQHIMDVTLASARLMEGYERSRQGGDQITEELFRFGILVAMFHDSGYIRRMNDRHHKNGAEYTQVHVARSGRMLETYLPMVGMGHLAANAAQVVHYTGYEVPVERIRVSDPVFRTIGSLIASADIIAQMSDRCYLEKCRDRLYPEFVLGGLATRRDGNGVEQVIFASADDLVMKTPIFYKGAKKRLEETMGGAYRYAERFFGGQNLYLEELEKNIRFAEHIAADGNLSRLQRSPPLTPGSDISPTAKSLLSATG